MFGKKKNTNYHMFVTDTGVYRTEIDSRQHKVTVTGNVDAETLIKKLSRSGKSVELWPEKPADQKKDKKPAEKSKGGGGGDHVNNNKKEKQEDQKNSTEPVEGNCIDADDGEDSDKEGPGDECEGAGGGGGGGGEGGKKKKKKKKKKKNEGENGGSAPPPPNNGGGKEIGDGSVDAHAHAHAPVLPENKAISKDLIGPPIQHAYPYRHPHMYYSPPPPPPAYGLSYNTSYPVSTTPSYYVGAPVMPMHAYNSYPRLPPPPPPSDPIKHYGHDHDDDEYESTGYCSIM